MGRAKRKAREKKDVAPGSVPAISATGDRGTVRLARALIKRALVTLPLLSDDARAGGLEALAAFAHKPSPASYLTAVRVLSQALVRHRVETFTGRSCQRDFEQGLEDLRGLQRLPPALLDLFSNHLPVDLRSGARLSALAFLLRSYDELWGRLEEEQQARWQRLGPAPRPRRRTLRFPVRARSPQRP